MGAIVDQNVFRSISEIDCPVAMTATIYHASMRWYPSKARLWHGIPDNDEKTIDSIAGLDMHEGQVTIGFIALFWNQTNKVYAVHHLGGVKPTLQPAVSLVALQIQASLAFFLSQICRMPK